MNNLSYQMSEIWSRIVTMLFSDDVLMYALLAVMVVIMLANLLEFLDVTRVGRGE